MSEWWCKNKTSPYDIRQDDKALIQAAIRLGELLLTYEDITSEQHDSIIEMLAFLRNLPAQARLGLHGEFGFQLLADDETWDEGHYGCWYVSVGRGMLEIFCNGRDDLPEFMWELCPAHKNLNNMTHAHDWIAQVSDPHALILPGKRLRIEASTWSVSDS